MNDRLNREIVMRSIRAADIIRISYDGLELDFGSISMQIKSGEDAGIKREDSRSGRRVHEQLNIKDYDKHKDKHQRNIEKDGAWDADGIHA